MNAALPVKDEAWTRFWTVFLHLSVLSHLSMTVCAAPHYTRKMLQSNSKGNNMEEVFTDGEEASMFLGRSLLLNRFDFEMFVPGNCERECYEEMCSYEEAREIFKDHDKTVKFWKEYSTKGPYAKPEIYQKIDVTGLLTGLVASGALLVIFWFTGYYIYKFKCKPRRQRPSSLCQSLGPLKSNQSLDELCECIQKMLESGYGNERAIPLSSSTVNRVRPSFRSSISRRLDHIFSSEPVPSAPLDLEPPSYEQAVALNGPHDVPPPPYPETMEEMRLYRKSISLPLPLSD